MNGFGESDLVSASALLQKDPLGRLGLHSLNTDVNFWILPTLIIIVSLE